MHHEIKLDGFNFEKIDLEKLSELVGGQADFYGQDKPFSKQDRHSNMTALEKPDDQQKND